MIWKVTDAVLQKDMKLSAAYDAMCIWHTEEMEIQMRGIKHLIYVIP